MEKIVNRSTPTGIESALLGQEDFPVLGHPDSGISEGVQKMVFAKSLLDNITGTSVGDAMVSQIVGKEYSYGTISPFSFAYTVLPFFRKMRCNAGDVVEYKALCPPEITIGDSWRWSANLRSPEEQQKIVKIVFEAFDQSTPFRRATECASYIYIPKLGIVLAHEGKNRVALFRKLEINIPAIVHDEDYPDPPPQNSPVFNFQRQFCRP